MIELHPEKKMPLYEQLYNALAQDIRSGALQPGKALPGRRTMAAQMKDIQEWLGHSDYSTTANIYSHLDYTAKLNSAETLVTSLDFAP